ncbi:MAG: hypothetical protein ABEI58_02470 [Candidatus Nanohaloarchaea archaeon]
MQEDAEIIRNEGPAEEDVINVIQDGEQLSQKYTKDVYSHEDALPDRIVKVPYPGSHEELARRLARIDSSLIPDIEMRVYDLSDAGYSGTRTVVSAEMSDHGLLEGLDDDNYRKRFLDGVELMDRAVSSDTAFTDLVWENLHYFDGGLKLIDLCEIGDVKSFPEDYHQPDDWQSFASDVEEMYTNFAVSGVYEASRSMEEAAELLEQSSDYIESATAKEDSSLRLDQQLRISLDESLFRY